MPPWVCKVGDFQFLWATVPRIHNIFQRNAKVAYYPQNCTNMFGFREMCQTVLQEAPSRSNVLHRARKGHQVESSDLQAIHFAVKWGGAVDMNVTQKRTQIILKKRMIPDWDRCCEGCQLQFTCNCRQRACRVAFPASVSRAWLWEGWTWSGAEEEGMNVNPNHCQALSKHMLLLRSISYAFTCTALANVINIIFWI
jgi:hypothetical protein